METQMSTAERNAWFATLPLAQQRVEIAREVLRYLDAGKIQAAQGWYVMVEGVRFEISQESLPELTTCHACGIGALLLARTLSFDNGVIQFDHPRRSWASAIEREQVEDGLNDIFDLEDLGLIESAFEGAAADSRNQENLKAEGMFTEYTSAEERLRTIMENIIANGGTFVVPAGEAG